MLKIGTEAFLHDFEIQHGRSRMLLLSKQEEIIRCYWFCSIEYGCYFGVNEICIDLPKLRSEFEFLVSSLAFIMPLKLVVSENVVLVVSESSLCV